MKNNNDWVPMPRFLLRKDAFKRTIKKIPLKNKNILEVGFGSGEILKMMASYGSNVTGFDFSSEAADLAKERIASDNNSNNITITQDESNLLKNHYDLVIAFEVLEHIEDDSEVFKRWLSYVKPGGSLIISVPAHQSKWCKNDVWAGHIKRYEKIDLINLCKDLRLPIKNLWNYGYPLTIVLDEMLNNLRNVNKNDLHNSDEKIQLTKKSGIDRKNKFIYRLLSNDFALFPFYILQRLFFKKDLGSGYILHAIKNV